MTIYTSRHVAGEALKRTFDLQSTRSEWGGGLAHFIGVGDGRPRAVLFRQIATPNYELRRFLRMCARYGFDPVVLQYSSDKMSCHNTFKRSLVAPMFLEGFSQNGQPIFRRHTLANIEKVDRQRLVDVSLGSRLLTELHTDLMRQALPWASVKLVDGNSWFGRYPSGARDYYVDLFAALTGDLMLFEDFLSDGSEAEFFERVVRPAFDAACSLLGQRPIVRRLCNNRRMASHLWYAYPASYRTYFNLLGCNL